MSRTKKFVSGIASGYVLLAINVLYTMGSIPLALRYLSREEFGLWAVVTQLASYLAIIDMGMSVSTARNIIDRKDNKTDKSYGAIVLTSTLVFLAQALIILILGSFAGPLATKLVDLHGQFVNLFSQLLFCQWVLLSLGFAARIFEVLLIAHQRYDIVNLSRSLQLVVMFGGLWEGFSMGAGIFSMVWAAVTGTVVYIAVCFSGCLCLKLFPAPGCWGRPQYTLFLELFMYGKDMFLISLGSQLMNTSQAVIITRMIGLDTVAAWSICTKLFIMTQQFITKIYDYSQSAFSEMYVRGEIARLETRFKDTVALTASFAAYICIAVAVCNSAFVRIWTGGKFAWGMENDVLMGTYIFFDAIFRCYGCFVVHSTKQVGFARWVYFVEGAVFVPLACIWAHYWKMPGILLAMVIVKILFSSSYGVYRVRLFFEKSYCELTWDCMRPAVSLAIVFGFVSWAAIQGGAWLSDCRTRLFALAAVMIFIGIPLLWRIGLSPRLRTEIWKILVGGISMLWRGFALRASKKTMQKEYV